MNAHTLLLQLSSPLLQQVVDRFALLIQYRAPRTHTAVSVVEPRAAIGTPDPLLRMLLDFDIPKPPPAAAHAGA